MEPQNLVEIVIKAQRGDSKAEQELYIISSKKVYFLALKILKHKNDAEDISQDVFITVFEKLPELKQPTSYYKWLNEITANKCMDFMRNKKPMSADEQDALAILELEDEDTNYTPEKLFDDEETRRIIAEIIDTLPELQRICIMYRYFNQLSIEDIAEITDTSEHTVKSRLAMARKKIRAAILKKEDDEGIRLHIFLPITPVLMKDLEDFQMPEGVTERMWEKIAESIAAGSAAAATAASEAAQAGAIEAAQAGAVEVAKAGAIETAKTVVSAKVIGIVAGAVAVAGVTTFMLWPEPEQPAQVATPPPSASAIAQTTTPPATDVPNETPAPNENGTDNPMPDGYGVYEYPHSDVSSYRYEGEWKNGSPNGQGTLYYVQTASDATGPFYQWTASGNFVDGFMNGIITLVWESDEETSSYSVEVNRGEMLGDAQLVSGNDFGLTQGYTTFAMLPWLYRESPW